MTTVASFRAAFDPLAEIGRNPATGGLNRFAWTDDDAAARSWFRREAERVHADRIETDRNGNLWAWFGEAGTSAADPAGAATAVVTGSHLDTVPEGGAYDGALGVVAGFLAVESVLTDEGGFERPVAVVAFVDEEGARFGVPCVGSRSLKGSLPAGVLERRDADGVTMAEAMRRAGVDPAGSGPDPDRLARLSCLVELHVEQGRQLDRIDAAVGVASEIWPHGRWRLVAAGEANHAGTTLLDDRRDPMQVVAVAVATARRLAADHGALATVGRVAVQPNGTNVIAHEATCWLDARAPRDAVLDALVEDFGAAVSAAAAAEGVQVSLEPESRSERVEFSSSLLARHPWPAVPTGAGHDAGILASVLPAAMLFARNRTGVSHSPDEHATDEDCVAGIDALAAVLVDLAC